MQLKEKEEETSNRLLDVRGHLVPEAEVIYIYLSPSQTLSSFLPLRRMLVIHFPCPPVPRQICEFKQVTFLGTNWLLEQNLYSNCPNFSGLWKHTLQRSKPFFLCAERSDTCQQKNIPVLFQYNERHSCWLNSSWEIQRGWRTTSFVILWKTIDFHCWVHRWDKEYRMVWIIPQGRETIEIIWRYWCGTTIIEDCLHSPSL